MVNKRQACIEPKFDDFLPVAPSTPRRRGCVMPRIRQATFPTCVKNRSCVPHRFRSVDRQQAWPRVEGTVMVSWVLGWLEGDRSVGNYGTNEQLLGSPTFTCSKRENGFGSEVSFPDEVVVFIFDVEFFIFLSSCNRRVTDG